MRSNLIWAGVVLVLLVALRWECKPGKAIVQPSHHAEDSIAARYDSILSRKDANFDSLHAAATQLQYRYDSLLVQDSALQFSAYAKVLTIHRLIAQQVPGEDRNCDSLITEVNNGIELVEIWRGNAQMMDSTLHAELAIKDSIIASFADETAKGRALFASFRIAADTRYDSLAKQIPHISTKPKRFSIGPFLGATYEAGNFKPTAGVGISYNLIKF